MSFPTDCDFVEATKDVLPWTDATHETGRKIIPSCFVEYILGDCPVPDPTSIRGHRFLTKCLRDAFICAAIDKLVEQEAIRRMEED